MITVRFFAGLREQLACDSVALEPETLATIEDVRNCLSGKSEQWARALDDPRIQAALNQQMAAAQATVKDGDEVAFFPPVTGG